MKKLFSLMLALVLVMGAVTAFAEGDDLLAQIQARGTLIIGTEGNWYPWTDMDTEGNFLGLDVEIGTRIAHELGVEPQFMKADWDALLAGVDSGRFDIICNGVGYTAERAEKYAFSTPYVYTRKVLVVRKDNEDIASVDDLKGKTTANSQGSTYAALGEQYGATVNYASTLGETILLVEQGRVDATINAQISVDLYLTEHPEANIKVVQVLDTADPVAYPMRKGDDTASLVEAVNAALQAMRDDGSLAEISLKYTGNDLTQPLE